MHFAHSLAMPNEMGNKSEKEKSTLRFIGKAATSVAV